MSQKIVHSKTHEPGVYVDTIAKHGKRYVVTMFTNRTVNGHHPVVNIPVEDVIRVEYEPIRLSKAIARLLLWCQRTFSKPMYK